MLAGLAAGGAVGVDTLGVLVAGAILVEGVQFGCLGWLLREMYRINSKLTTVCDKLRSIEAGLSRFT